MNLRLTTRVALFGVLLLSGYASRTWGTRIVQAPNHSGSMESEPSMSPIREVSQKLGSPEWSLRFPGEDMVLSVKVIEPGDYQFVHRWEIVPNPDGETARGKFAMDWEQPRDLGPEIPFRGTVTVLHGIYGSKEMMLPWALYLAQLGYRCVLVDLRGHGQSTGDWITYGVAETRDLSHLVDELQRRGMAGRNVGGFGLCYGASVGLMFAAHDERVATVVALQPFADAREAVPEFVRAMYPKIGAKLSDAEFARALDRAERQASFSWAETDVRKAVRQLTVPVLLYHGAETRG